MTLVFFSRFERVTKIDFNCIFPFICPYMNYWFHHQQCDRIFYGCSIFEFAFRVIHMHLKCPVNVCSVERVDIDMIGHVNKIFGFGFLNWLRCERLHTCDDNWTAKINKRIDKNKQIMRRKMKQVQLIISLFRINCLFYAYKRTAISMVGATQNSIYMYIHRIAQIKLK